MRRHERTSEEWAIIAQLLPDKLRGVARAEAPVSSTAGDRPGQRARYFPLLAPALYW